MSRSPGDVQVGLSIEEAAEYLGVHYMTVYRYIRQGRLGAHREAGRWRIDKGALEAVGESGPTRGFRPPRDIHETRRRLLGRITEGDIAGSWAILDAAMRAGHPPVHLYVELLGPVLKKVGDEWEAGRRSIESEHRVSAVAMRLVGRIEARGHRPGRRRRATVLLGGAPGDPHQLPLAMVADVLRWDGYHVLELGANVPAQSFVHAARTTKDLAAAGVSLSADRNSGAAATVLRELRNAKPDVFLLAGGPAVVDEAAARRLGADGWAAEAGAVPALVRTRE